MWTKSAHSFLLACLSVCFGQQQTQLGQVQAGQQAEYGQPQEQVIQYGQINSQQYEQSQNRKTQYGPGQYEQAHGVKNQYNYQENTQSPIFQHPQGVKTQYGYQQNTDSPVQGPNGANSYYVQESYPQAIQVIPYGTDPPPSKKVQPKTVMCYSCSYTPDRMVFQLFREVDARSADGKPTSYKTRLQEKMVKGGWKPCQGPFDRHKASRMGVGAIPCTSNCYSRVDQSGNLLRGCLDGEYGVDPNKVGCSVQGGMYYCFCEGDYCNAEVAPTYPDSQQ